MIDRSTLFAALATSQTEGTEAPSAGVISVPALVAAWLARGPQRFPATGGASTASGGAAGEDRHQLEALCRQIDVRRKVATAYAPGWKRIEPEVMVPDGVLSGLVAVLLANAAGIGEEGEDGSHNDGWGLKCTNSALKALDLSPGAPSAPELRAWAMERLDAIR